VTAPPTAARQGAPRTLRLVLSGTAAVGVGFGLARYGYGLLLPQIRRDLGLDRTVLGLIASAAYLSYLLACALATRILATLGLRGTVATAGALATSGMLLVAGATGPVILAARIFVAGAAPALVWPPYLDAVEQHVPAGRRDTAHGLINSGTAYGVALAAPIALLTGNHWRLAWVAFAGCAATVTAWAVTALPRSSQHPRRPRQPALAPAGRTIRPTAATLPLFTASFVIGVCGGAYWTFGVDAVATGQLLGPAGGPIFQIVVGLSGVVGGLAGRLVTARGTRAVFLLFAGLVAVSQLALAAAAGPLLTLASAALFGTGYIGVLGVTAIWTARVFADHPSSGLVAAMFAMGLGLAAGPAIAGPPRRTCRAPRGVPGRRCPHHQPAPAGTPRHPPQLITGAKRTGSSWRTSASPTDVRGHPGCARTPSPTPSRCPARRPVRTALPWQPLLARDDLTASSGGPSARTQTHVLAARSTGTRGPRAMHLCGLIRTSVRRRRRTTPRTLHPSAGPSKSVTATCPPVLIGRGSDRKIAVGYCSCMRRRGRAPRTDRSHQAVR